jgi:muramoyltetrapeptide carboxypeptidase LdcA involved in peptidoglycan recycling
MTATSSHLKLLRELSGSGILSRVRAIVPGSFPVCKHARRSSDAGKFLIGEAHLHFGKCLFPRYEMDISAGDIW